MRDAVHAARRVAAGDGIRLAAVAFAITCVYSSVVSVRDDLPGRPLGLRIPLTVPVGLLVGWGAAVAAPWPMPLGALVAATRARDADAGDGAALVCAGIGVAGVVGLLMEPNTYAVRTQSPANRVAIVAGFVTTSALAVAGLRRWGAARGGGTSGVASAVTAPRG